MGIMHAYNRLLCVLSARKKIPRPRDDVHMAQTHNVCIIGTSKLMSGFPAPTWKNGMKEEKEEGEGGRVGRRERVPLLQLSSSSMSMAHSLLICSNQNSEKSTVIPVCPTKTSLGGTTWTMHVKSNHHQLLNPPVLVQPAKTSTWALAQHLD